jgi:integrase-like protein
LKEARDHQSFVTDPFQRERLQQLSLGRVSLDEYLATYLKTKHSWTPSTRLRNEGVIRNYVLPGRLGQKKLWSITRDDTLDALELPRSRAVGTPEADYPHRAILTRREWRGYLSIEAGRIDYPNFKSRVLELQGRQRHDAYVRVWSTLPGMEHQARADDRARKNSRLGEGAEFPVLADEDLGIHEAGSAAPRGIGDAAGKWAWTRRAATQVSHQSPEGKLRAVDHALSRHVVVDHAPRTWPALDAHEGDGRTSVRRDDGRRRERHDEPALGTKVPSGGRDFPPHPRDRRADADRRE